MYSYVPFAFLLLPKHFTFESLASRVPNWMAFFLKVDAFSSPRSFAIFLRSFFSPVPYVNLLSSTVLKYFHKGRYKNGYLTYFAFIDMALSSRPKFLIQSLYISNSISFYISSYPALLNAILYLLYPENISSAPRPVKIIFALVYWLAMCKADAMLKSMCVVFG